MQARKDRILSYKLIASVAALRGSLKFQGRPLMPSGPEAACPKIFCILMHTNAKHAPSRQSFAMQSAGCRPLECMLQSKITLLKGSYLQHCASNKQDWVFNCSMSPCSCNDRAESECQRTGNMEHQPCLLQCTWNRGRTVNWMEVDWRFIQDNSLLLKGSVTMSCYSFLGRLLFVLADLVLRVSGLTFLLLPHQPVSATCKPADDFFFGYARISRYVP